MIGVVKKTVAAGAIALTMAAGMTAFSGTADAFRVGVRGGGVHVGIGGRGFGYRGFGGRGYGYGRGFGYGYGRGFGYRRLGAFYGAYPYWGGHRCGPYRRAYGGCGYRAYGY